MQKLSITYLAAILCLLTTRQAAAGRIDVDLLQKYGSVTLHSINQAVQDAKQHFKVNPGDTVVIRLPAGVFALAQVDEEAGGIDVSGVHPSADGRLVVQGAGKAATTLVFNSRSDEILGWDTSHVSFVGLHFTVGHMTVSQGHVEQVLPEAVVLRIEPGFPTPADLFNPDSDRGRYLRRCDEHGALPRMIDGPDDAQVAWLQATPLSGRDWRLDLKPAHGRVPFAPGDLVAIKSKGIDGNAYRFIGGDDIVFDDVAWSRVTRGVFRGTNDVKILNASLLRDPPVQGQVPCLASAGGGPQIGQPRDPAVTGSLVENFTADGTGDDSLAFFNASGTVRHARIADSFARGVLLFRSPGVSLEDVLVSRAPILRR